MSKVYYLYVLSWLQDEGGNYDDHDIKTMLHGLGLVGQLPVATLMDLHQSVKPETFGAGRLHVTDLLRTGQLVVQQLERGLDLHTALYDSAIEVYVRPQREPHTKQVNLFMLAFLCRKIIGNLTFMGNILGKNQSMCCSEFLMENKHTHLIESSMKFEITNCD